MFPLTHNAPPMAKDNASKRKEKKKPKKEKKK